MAINAEQCLNWKRGVAQIIDACSRCALLIPRLAGKTGTSGQNEPVR